MNNEDVTLPTLRLPLGDLRRMNLVRTGDLIDRLVTRDCLHWDPRLECSTMVFPLCHDNLLSDATMPQPHYLIYWSKKAGVLYLLPSRYGFL